MSILMEGFAQACQRFYDVMRNREARTFWPLFESLAWTYAIDERLQAAWEARGESDRWYDGFMHGDVAKGVRYGSHVGSNSTDVWFPGLDDVSNRRRVDEHNGVANMKLDVARRTGVAPQEMGRLRRGLLNVQRVLAEHVEFARHSRGMLRGRVGERTAMRLPS